MREGNLMGHQIAQHPIQGPLAFKLLKDQLDDGLDMGIGVLDDVPGGGSDIPHRHRHPEGTPLRFRLLPCQEALLENV
jgi:hypothetical protein